MSNATPRQTFALFCGTGLDCRPCNFTLDEASVLISSMKAGNDITARLIERGATGTPKKNAVAQSADFEAVWAEAHRVGMEAGNAVVPIPMVVVEHTNPLDDNSPIARQYAPVMDGVCGFAWISFKGNTAFGRWAKKKGIAKPKYGGGLSIWVSQFNQSLTRKEKYAEAVADVLRKHGVKAYAGSRMD